MKLVLIGCPGAGKGTQAKLISKHFEIPHISTGDLLRETVKDASSPIGKEISALLTAGQLVPDELVEGMIKERTQRDDCKNGYILDGYPRNLTQAQKLSDVVGEIDYVVYITVEESKIIERMVGRRACPKCGHMFHIKYNPPKADGICDACGESLIQRSDDTEETVVNRLKVYHDNTEPVINFYAQKGILVEIDGSGDIAQIGENIISALEKGN